MRSNPFKKTLASEPQHQQHQQEFSSVKMQHNQQQQQQQRSRRLHNWSLHQMRAQPVEHSAEQQLIISIKDHYHHCRAIPAAQSGINNNNKNALSRKNSTCSRPQKPSSKTDAIAASAFSFPQAMYSITSVQRQSNKRYPLDQRPARPHKLSLLRPSAATTLLLMCLSALVGLALLQQPTQALFFSEPAAASLPADSAPDQAPLDKSSSEAGAGSSSAAESPLLNVLQKVVSAAVSSATAQQQQPQQSAASSTSSSSSSLSSAPSGGGSQPATANAPNSQQAQPMQPAAGSSASSSVANALVSSISSAVASAAVSAAQNALTGGDARTSAARNHAGSGAQHPNRAVHLALKIAADAIPEVPYNILHNMKKLDHAAPFYNVGKKTGGHLGSSKESTSLLASALSSASHGRFGGAAGQLSSILKSPIWKRIADGYGDFTSEFRSIFRAPANPMKGPTSSTSTKLLRDISVPALLMLIAAAMPSEWRPVRSRRKLLPPSISDIPQIMDPMSTSSSEQVSSLSAIPFINPALSSPTFGSFLQQASPAVARYQQIQPRELLSSLGGAQLYGQMGASGGSPQSRSGDINLQPRESANGFMGAQHWNQQANLQQQQVKHPVDGPVEQLSASSPDAAATQMQPAQLSQPTRRLGELALPAPFTVNSMQVGQQKPLASFLDTEQPKPVNRISKRAPYLSRALSYMPSLLFLTSSLTPAGKQQPQFGEINSQLMRRVFGLVGKNRMVNNKNNVEAASASVNGEETLSKREDQLSDRHRYSMIDADVGGASGRASQLDNAGSSSRPFLLSAMTYALNSALESGLSGLSPHLHHVAPSSTNNNKVEMLADKSAGARKEQLRRNSIQQQQQQQSGQQLEQRQLSQLIPQAWKDVIKRTMTSVQQQASNQWRSIEGQLTNWMQDKLKAAPSSVSSAGPSSTSASSSPSASSGNAQAAAPVSNILASAKNLLGFGTKSSSSTTTSPTGTTGTTSAPSEQASSAASSASANESSSDGPKNKNDTSSSSKKQNNPNNKGALSGITNMIASVFTS